MTTRPPSPDFDRLLTAWFDADARVREPDDLLDRTSRRTARTRPRPAWRLPERWIPMELTMRRVRCRALHMVRRILVVLFLVTTLSLLLPRTGL